MNEKKIEEFAIRLNKIYNDEYLRYHRAMDEVASDLRTVVLSPEANVPKLRLNPEKGEIVVEAEDKLHKAFRQVLGRASELNEDVEDSEGVLLSKMHETGLISDKLAVVSFETYCTTITDTKSRKAVKSELKVKEQDFLNRTISEILESGELHISYQNKSGMFKGYKSFDRLLSKAQIIDYPDLEIFLHHKAKENEMTDDFDVGIGSLKREDGFFYVNSDISLGNDITSVVRWIEACYTHLAGTPKHFEINPDFPMVKGITRLTKKDGATLARIVQDYLSNGTPSERKSFKLLSDALGEEVAEHFKTKGFLSVISKNGKEYIIDEEGDVYERETRRKCCVVVEDDLPRYDRILAKYLIVRDKPEMIDTLCTTEVCRNVEHDRSYHEMFAKILRQHLPEVRQMGLDQTDFFFQVNILNHIWTISSSFIELKVDGGIGLKEVPDEPGDLTREVWESIGTDGLTEDFLESEEYMEKAFEHFLAYLEKNFAWTPEHAVLEYGLQYFGDIGLDTIRRRLYDAELMIERASGENELGELKEREHELLDMLHEAEDRRYARLKRVEQILDEIE